MGKLNPKQVENLIEPGTYEDGDCWLFAYQVRVVFLFNRSLIPERVVFLHAW